MIFYSILNSSVDFRELVGEHLSRLIATGISKGPHKFSLKYSKLHGIETCFARCACGFQVEIFQFRGWGGTRELQKRWEEHIGEK